MRQIYALACGESREMARDARAAKGPGQVGKAPNFGANDHRVFFRSLQIIDCFAHSCSLLLVSTNAKTRHLWTTRACRKSRARYRSLPGMNMTESLIVSL